MVKARNEAEEVKTWAATLMKGLDHESSAVRDVHWVDISIVLAQDR